MNDTEQKKKETLSATEIAFIERLRDEAEAVKDCYTRFSFQSWVFSVAALGVIFRFQEDAPYVGLMAILPIVLLLSVGRIGIHKYTTANRIHGFELYMNRRKRLKPASEADGERFKTIGWEEAYYAWRVVQASIYSETYTSSLPNEKGLLRYLRWGVPIKLRHRAFAEDILFKTNWNGSALLYPGSYLKVNFAVMYFFCSVSLLPLATIPVFLYIDSASWIAIAVAALVFFATLICVAMRSSKLGSRRKIIETGLLSINSCALLWSIVVPAHFRALDAIADEESGDLTSFRGYTDALAQQTGQILALYREKGSEGLYEWQDKGFRTQLDFTF